MTETLAPTFQDITPAEKSVTSMAGWYLSPSVQVLTADVPWLMSQGWEMTGKVYKDIRGDIYAYQMSKTTLQNANVLSAILNDFTDAYNEGRAANDTRYEDILNGLLEVLNDHQADVTTFQDNKYDDAAAGHITLLLTTQSSLETDYSSFETDWNSYDDADRSTQLANLKTVWSAAAEELDSDYDTLTAGLDLPSLIASVSSSIDDLDAAVADFNTAYGSLRATLESDFTTHSETSRNLLVDLGATELARINEQFDNLKSRNNQSLVTRGLYSSALVTQMEAQVERERNQAIVELNDRLSREQLENEHRLYGEQYQMRLGALDVPLRAIQATAQAVSARLQHGQWASTVRHEVMRISAQARLQVLDVRERYYQRLLESITWESERRERLFNQLMQVRLQQFELRNRVCDKEFELLRYQLDTRNNLAAALFGFVERRTDGYPDLNAMAQLTASLSQTGAATWQSA